MGEDGESRLREESAKTSSRDGRRQCWRAGQGPSEVSSQKESECEEWAEESEGEEEKKRSQSVSLLTSGTR